MTKSGQVASLLSLIFGCICIVCSVPALINLIQAIQKGESLSISGAFGILAVYLIGVPLAFAAFIFGLIGRSRAINTYDVNSVRSSVFSIIGIIGAGVCMVTSFLVFFGM